MSSLDNIRKEAKRWLRALREHDTGARARLLRAYPAASAEPGLRDVQHALAREHGYDDWKAFTAAVAVARPPDDDSAAAAVAAAAAAAAAGRAHAERVGTFLELACWDHHVHGRAAHARHARAALRLLDRDPEIARDSLYTASVCGDLAEVERIVSERPEAAREAGGARGWTPLLYLCFARIPYASTIANAVAIARCLLERGGDPNASYMAGGVRYSALAGVAGEGEGDAPRQPQASALFRALLEGGAEPFDIQVLYNTHFSGDVLWWLTLIHEHTARSDRGAAWHDPDWAMLDMGGLGAGAAYVLGLAVERDDRQLAEWCLERGARPGVDRPLHPKARRRDLNDLRAEAVHRGFTEMADLLVRYGATADEVPLDDHERFVAACLGLDREAVRTHLQSHPEYLRSHTAIFAAARLDRPEVVSFLLDLGVSIEVEDGQKQRPLHEASSYDARRTAALLIARGADVDPREDTWGATPLSYAVYGGMQPMIELLSPFSRDVWSLTQAGNVDRLREVLRAEPHLAKSAGGDGTTLLMCLPDDEVKAAEIVDLLLAHGADPSARTAKGTTAADAAATRGLDEAARRLAARGA